jgi:hypothetical protein
MRPNKLRHVVRDVVMGGWDEGTLWITGGNRAIVQTRFGSFLHPTLAC